MSNRAAIIFFERTAAPGWLRVLGSIAWACGLALLVLAIVDRDAIFGSAGGEFGAIVGVLVLTAVGWLSWRAAIVVTVTDSAVLISFRPIRTITIPRADIASVGTEMLSPSAFGGVGLRFLPPHDWAFLFDAGAGFVLERITRSTHYHVRSDQAQQIVTILSAHQADNPIQSKPSR